MERACVKSILAMRQCLLPSLSASGYWHDVMYVCQGQREREREQEQRWQRMMDALERIRQTEDL